MPTPAETAAAYQRRVAAAAAATAIATANRWDLVDPDDIIGSWGELVPAVTGITTAGQLTAAEAGAAYTPSVIRAQGAPPNPAGQVRTQALAGVASDGRPLGTLLELPAVQSVRQMSHGMALDDALSQARGRLMMFAATQVLDAGRMGASVGMVSDRSVTGYRRQLRGTSCARCAILAGVFYRWNAGFERHPNCDCVHVPAVGPKSDLTGLEGFDSNAYFDSLDEATQDRVFTKGGAAAIRDGADMNQVVNARRGMRSTNAYGRTVRSTSVSAKGGVRLMPEQIYADAAGDRAEAIRQLRRHRYLA